MGKGVLLKPRNSTTTIVVSGADFHGKRINYVIFFFFCIIQIFNTDIKWLNFETPSLLNNFTVSSYPREI